LRPNRALSVGLDQSDGRVRPAHRAGPALSADERLFALGTRTLADLISPAGIEVHRDHLQLDAQYVRARWW
jgi:hypothetical protein